MIWWEPRAWVGCVDKLLQLAVVYYSQWARFRSPSPIVFRPFRFRSWAVTQIEISWRIERRFGSSESKTGRLG